jgi:hypothetical protein
MTIFDVLLRLQICDVIFGIYVIDYTEDSPNCKKSPAELDHLYGNSKEFVSHAIHGPRKRRTEWTKRTSVIAPFEPDEAIEIKNVWCALLPTMLSNLVDSKDSQQT